MLDRLVFEVLPERVFRWLARVLKVEEGLVWLFIDGDDEEDDDPLVGP